MKCYNAAQFVNFLCFVLDQKLKQQEKKKKKYFIIYKSCIDMKEVKLLQDYRTRWDRFVKSSTIVAERSA